MGQDLYLRTANGAGFSLLLGLGVTIINFLIGLVWGAIAGYYGGKVDLAMERVTDILSAIPSIVIMTLVSLNLKNNPSLGNIAPVVALLIGFVATGWIGTSSTTRMQFYRYKGQEYVLASRTLGAKDRRLIFRHILPNAAGTLVTSTVLMIPSVIFSESTLTYFGIINLSLTSTTSLGTLLSEGQGVITSEPYLIVFPALVISLLMISFNLFGNGLRDAFNTTLRGED
jgi:oligopeptide transport system permease protein